MVVFLQEQLVWPEAVFEGLEGTQQGEMLCGVSSWHRPSVPLLSSFACRGED